MKRCSRITIMAGEVVTFAPGFVAHDGVFKGYDASGQFEVSVSRNGICVHQACCKGKRDVEQLMWALWEAHRIMPMLRCGEMKYEMDPVDVMTPVPGAEIPAWIADVDPEIRHLVAMLNANGVPTVASCSGHGHRPGNIALRDGRELIIARDFAEARKIEALFPVNNQGESIAELQQEMKEAAEEAAADQAEDLGEVLSAINAHMHPGAECPTQATYPLGECPIIQPEERMWRGRKTFTAVLSLWPNVAANSLGTDDVVRWFTEVGCHVLRISQVMHERAVPGCVGNVTDGRCTDEGFVGSRDWEVCFVLGKES